MPLLEVLAEYCEFLTARGITVKHTKAVTRIVHAAAKASGADAISGLDTAAVDRYLAGLLQEGQATATRNLARAILGGFFTWAERQGYITSNPTRPIPALRNASDRRRLRRPLTTDECWRLLHTAPARHRLYYRMAIRTGLRRKELRSLHWPDIDLDGTHPAVHLAPSQTKSRQSQKVPLARDLVEELVIAKSNANSMLDRIFPETPSVASFRRDCDVAGINWRLNSHGQVVDVHSLRYTFITALAEAGVSLPLLIKLARHSNPRLTLETYTLPGQAALAAAIGLLPPLQANTGAYVSDYDGKRMSAKEKGAQAGLAAGCSAPTSPSDGDGGQRPAPSRCLATVGWAGLQVIADSTLTDEFGGFPNYLTAPALDLSRLPRGPAEATERARQCRGAGTARTVQGAT